MFLAGSFNLDGRIQLGERVLLSSLYEEFAAVGQTMFDEDLAVNGVYPISLEWMDENISWYERLMMQTLALGSSLL